MEPRPRGHSVNEPIAIRPGAFEDVPRLVQLLQDCIAEMRRQGIEQWDDVYPNEGTLRADAAEKTLYVASDAVDDLVGLFVLNEWQNPEYAEVPWTIDAARIG